VARHGPPVRLSVLLLATVLLAGCGTVRDYLGGEDNLEPPAELVEFTPTVQVRKLWSRQIGAGFDRQYLKLVPVVREGRIYVAERKGRVAAYDAASGERVWERSTGSRLAGGPGVGEGLVVVGGSDGEVIALKAEDGEPAWQVQVSSEVLAQPRAGYGVVVVRTVDGKLYGLDPADGQRIWVYDRTVPVLSLRGTSSPVLAAGLVIAGFDSGRLVALSVRNAEVIWEARIAEPRGRSELERLVDVDADPVVADDTVYAVTYNGRIAAFDLQTGAGLWRRDMSSHEGLSVGPTQVFVTDARDHVWALKRSNSVSMWKQSQLQGRRLTAPAVFRDWVVVGDAEGYVHWLRREDGQFAARLRIDSDGIIAQPVATADALYVYGAGGELAALTTVAPQ